MVADNAQLKREPAFRSVTERRRHAGIGHRNHDVGIHMALARQLAADALSRLIDTLALDHAVRSSEIDVFEDAEPPGHLREGFEALHPARADHDDFARLDIADEVG